jgi:glyoxylase-like metal-dependent hydrolase (beta-lactamase superfamily II)
MIPFVAMPAFEYGPVDMVSPLIRRVVANNPGPFTYTGTGTYIVGRSAPGAGVAVIDPGPLDEAHLAALLAAVEGQTVSHVLVTHTHRDHAPLACPFAEAVGAPILAAAPPVRTIHASATPDEDDDESFSPDIILCGGERLAGDAAPWEGLQARAAAAQW